LRIVVGGVWPVNGCGAGIVQGVLDAGKMGGEAAEVLGVDAGFDVDEVEASKDGGFGAMVFAGDPGGGHFLDTIEAKDGQGGRNLHAALDVEVLDEGEGAAGDVFIHFAGLRGETGEKLAGGLARVEGALIGKGDVDVQGEESGAVVFEDGLGRRVEEIAGWSEEDEGLAEMGGELGDDAAKDGILDLDGEDGGHGVGRPGANLEGIWRGKVGEFGGELEGFAEGARQPGAVEFEGSYFLERQGDVGAGWRVALAGGDGGGAVVPPDDKVVAAATAGTGN
jgi:hypothetical protein